MNKISIRKETYEGVTAVPHFPVVIDYEGCHVEIEDVYFQNLEALAHLLEEFERSRKGEVCLDGGPRFAAVLSLDSHGGLLVRFRAEPVPFPGRLQLEGHFEIEGEFTGQQIREFRGLLSAGDAINIEQRSPLRRTPLSAGRRKAPKLGTPLHSTGHVFHMRRHAIFWALAILQAIMTLSLSLYAFGAGMAHFDDGEPLGLGPRLASTVAGVLGVPVLNGLCQYLPRAITQGGFPFEHSLFLINGLVWAYGLAAAYGVLRRLFQRKSVIR